MNDYIFLENSFFQTKILNHGHYNHLKIVAQRYLQEQKFVRGYHNTQFMLIPVATTNHTLSELLTMSELELTNLVNSLIDNPTHIEFFNGVFESAVA